MTFQLKLLVCVLQAGLMQYWPRSTVWRSLDTSSTTWVWKCKWGLNARTSNHDSRFTTQFCEESLERLGFHSGRPHPVVSTGFKLAVFHFLSYNIQTVCMHDLPLCGAAELMCAASLSPQSLRNREATKGEMSHTLLQLWDGVLVRGATPTGAIQRYSWFFSL